MNLKRRQDLCVTRELSGGEQEIRMLRGSGLATSEAVLKHLKFVTDSCFVLLRSLNEAQVGNLVKPTRNMVQPFKRPFKGPHISTRPWSGYQTVAPS